MKYAIIENAIVINTAIAEPEYAKTQGWVELTGNAGIGWGYVDGQFIEPPPPDYSAENKLQAESLLQATDWVELPSVSDPSSTPHLINVTEFLAYRSALRSIAVNPPSEPAVFPVAPSEIWV